jgi:hypothetical protein
MHELDVQRTEMLVRAYDFALSHMDAFKTDSLGTQKFGILAWAIDQLRKHGEPAMQCSKASARWILMESMEAIDRTAEAVALDYTVEEDQFRTPWVLNDLAILGAARRFVEDARPLQDAFVALAMPVTFVEDLQADIARLEQAIHDQTEFRGDELETMTRIDDALERAMEALLHLDAIVANTFEFQDYSPEAAIAWECLRIVLPAEAGKNQD